MSAFPRTVTLVATLLAVQIQAIASAEPVSTTAVEQQGSRVAPAPSSPLEHRLLGLPRTSSHPALTRRPRAILDLVDVLRRPPAGKTDFEVAVYRSPSGVVVFGYEEIGGLAVAEGDIILGPIEQVRAQQARLRASGNTAAFALVTPGTPELGRRWPNGVIHFTRHPDLAENRNAAIDFAIGEYERLSPLRFEEGQGDGNFIEFVNQLPFFASMSELGMRGGRQEIKIRSASDLTQVALNRSILHELGHAIGFKHEHSRPDRDEFVEIDFECTDFFYDISGNWDVLSDYDMIGPYDFDSIMHYATSDACRAGTGCCDVVKRPEHRDDGDDIGAIGPSTRLSTRDINAIWLMYSESPARNEQGDWYGLRVLAHDFDGDDIADLVVGAPREDTAGSRRGAVYLYKGTEGRPVYWKRLIPPATDGSDSRFGTALAAGDFNNDRIQDVAVGAPRATSGDQTATGTVYVYSVFANADSQLYATLRKDEGPEAFDQFGASLAALNGAGGTVRLAVGAPGGRNGLRRPGAVYVVELSGEPAFARVSTQGHYIANFRSFGYAMTAARLPGANEDLLFVSAPTVTMDDDLSRGSPSVFTVGRAADGTYVIGSRLVSPDVTPAPAGTPIIEPGVILNGWPPVVEPDFGRSLATGDFDGDGDFDLAVGSSLSSHGGRVFLFEREGIIWVPRGTLDQTGLDQNEDSDGFGAALAAGDLDGDGLDDLVVSAVGENRGGAWNAGDVYVFRGGATLEPWRTLRYDVVSLLVDLALMLGGVLTVNQAVAGIGWTPCSDRRNVLQFKNCSTFANRNMKQLNVREMRAAIGRLDELVAEAGELVVSRNGKPIARVLPYAKSRTRPDHADLRALTPRLSTPSADLIRAERDER